MPRWRHSVFPFCFNFSCFYRCSRSLYNNYINLSTCVIIVKANKKISVSKSSEKQISWKKKEKKNRPKKQNLSRPNCKATDIKRSDGKGDHLSPTFQFNL